MERITGLTWVNSHQVNRRDFLKTAGVIGFGGAIYACGWSGFIQNAEAADSPETKSGSSPAGFFFVQLSDPHWGFKDPRINPDYAGTLKKAIVAVNALALKRLKLPRREPARADGA